MAARPLCQHSLTVPVLSGPTGAADPTGHLRQARPGLTQTHPHALSESDRRALGLVSGESLMRAKQREEGMAENPTGGKERSKPSRSLLWLPPPSLGSETSSRHPGGSRAGRAGPACPSTARGQPGCTRFAPSDPEADGNLRAPCGSFSRRLRLCPALSGSRVLNSPKSPHSSLSPHPTSGQQGDRSTPVTPEFLPTKAPSPSVT